MMLQTASQEDGFTLVELLVAMSISLIVLFATLQSLDLFTSNAASQSRVTGANDQVRLTMDRTVRDLRGASVILIAQSNDLAYAVPKSTGGVRIERICLASPGIYTDSTSPPTATPPTGACASGTRIATVRSTDPLAFSYDGAASAPGAAAGLVRNVGLKFSLDASGGGRTAGSTLTASAAVRTTVGTLPDDDNDIRVVCGSAGPLVSIGIGLPVELGPLTVAYTTNNNVTIAGVTVSSSGSGQLTALPPGTTAVTAVVNDALGITRALLNKTVGCVA